MNPSDPKRIALVPFTPVMGETKKNLQNITAIVKDLQTSAHPDLIVFPELATSGYLLENLVFSSAIKIPDNLPEELLSLSNKSEIILGANLSIGNQFYNGAIVLFREKIIHVQEKLYLPTYGLFDESRYFTAGKNTNVYNGVLGNTAILICEDAFHPAIAYSLFLRKARHVIIISSSPARGVQNDPENTDSFLRWKKRLEVYAESFGTVYMYVNRSGTEDGVFFDGRSLAVYPSRTQVGESGKTHIEEYFSSELDLSYQTGGPASNANPHRDWKILQESYEIFSRK